MEKNTTEPSSELQTTAVSHQQNDLPVAAALSAVYCFDDEYLQRLNEKLCCLREHSDSRIQDAALRLIPLC